MQARRPAGGASQAARIEALLAEIRFYRACLALCVVIILILLAVLVGTRRTRYARAIRINGQLACLVRDQAAADQVLKILLERGRKGYQGNASLREAWDTVTWPLGRGDKVLSVDEAVAKLAPLVHVVVDCAAILVNGKPVVYLPTAEEAQRAIELLLKHYTPKGGKLMEPPKFRERVQVQLTSAPPDKVVATAEEAVQKIVQATGERYYTVQKGDYPDRIAKKFGMSRQELYRLNPGVEWTKLRVGQKIRVKGRKPLVTVVAVVEEVKREKYRVPDEEVKTASLPRGQRRRVREGEPGEKEVRMKVVYENGRPVRREKLEERIVKPAKPGRVMVGTAAGQARGTSGSGARTGGRRQPARAPWEAR